MNMNRRQVVGAGLLAGFLPIFAKKWKALDLKIPSDDSPIILPEARVATLDVPSLLHSSSGAVPIWMGIGKGQAYEFIGYVSQFEWHKPAPLMDSIGGDLMYAGFVDPGEINLTIKCVGPVKTRMEG